MPRKRMIDPEFWSDEEIGSWPPIAKLFYIGLWNFSDDNGRFKAHRRMLYAQIFPYSIPRNITFCKLKQLLGNKVVWYEVEGLQYGHLRNFNKHQRIDRPTPSKLPPPPKVKIDEPSTNTRQQLAPNISQVNIKESNLRETSKNNNLILSLLTGLNAREQAAVINSWCPSLKKQGRCFECSRCKNDLENITKKVNEAKPDKYAAYLLKAINNFITGD